MALRIIDARVGTVRALSGVRISIFRVNMILVSSAEKGFRSCISDIKSKWFYIKNRNIHIFSLRKKKSSCYSVGRNSRQKNTSHIYYQRRIIRYPRNRMPRYTVRAQRGPVAQTHSRVIRARFLLKRTFRYRLSLDLENEIFDRENRPSPR